MRQKLGLGLIFCVVEEIVHDAMFDIVQQSADRRL